MIPHLDRIAGAESWRGRTLAALLVRCELSVSASDLAKWYYLYFVGNYRSHRCINCCAKVP